MGKYNCNCKGCSKEHNSRSHNYCSCDYSLKCRVKELKHEVRKLKRQVEKMSEVTDKFSKNSDTITLGSESNRCNLTVYGNIRKVPLP